MGACLSVLSCKENGEGEITPQKSTGKNPSAPREHIMTISDLQVHYSAGREEVVT